MRIGLIAMSGIRVCDAELLRLGLTLPGFVERSEAIASLPSLGLLTLAAMTPAGHEVAYREVADLPGEGEPLEPFDLVGISTFTAQAFEAYELADRYRAAGTPVVIGGLHATALAEEAAEHADAVVVGEGEPVWAEVVADAEAGRLSPVYDARMRQFDLGEAPMPAYELLELAKYNRVTVQTSRGCPWRCEFCASSLLLSPRYKQKPVEKVLAEVDRICELWPRPFIEFADDNSFVNRRYWKELLPELAKRNVKWFTETDISVAEDDDLLDMLRDAGCAELLVGLESPVTDGLKGLEMRADWKWHRLPRYREAVRRIQSSGVRVNGCFVLGLDGHKPTIFSEVFAAAEQMELYDVQVTLQTPFPGTPLYERLTKEGRMLEDRPWDRCTLFDLTHEPRGMSGEDLVKGLHELAAALYSSDFTHWRRELFRHKYRRGRRQTGEG